MSCNSTTCDHQTCKDTQEIQSSELPIYDKASLPVSGKLVLLVEEPDYDNGGNIVAAYRIPLSRIAPGAAPQSVLYSLSDPDAGIVIPDGEIVPAYVESFGNFDLKRAQATSTPTKAKFLIVGMDQNIDGNYIIQSSGFFSFPTVHEYAVGNTYYLSDSVSGGVTTTPPPGIAQPLFFVVDQKTILIQIGS